MCASCFVGQILCSTGRATKAVLFFTVLTHCVPKHKAHRSVRFFTPIAGRIDDLFLFHHALAVDDIGFEPMTSDMSRLCSNQLS
jgi:hypothetical protein